MNLPLKLPQGSAPAGDDLGRVYTPMPLAEAIVAALPELPARPYIVDPGVGGGSLIRAARKRWPLGRFLGVDVDPFAPGFADCDDIERGSWLDEDRMRARIPVPVDLVIGNPPFGRAVGAKVTAEHVLRALVAAELVAVILPVQVLCQSVFRTVVDSALRPQPEVLWVPGRPWTDVREVAVFVWGSDRPGTHRILPGW